MTTATEKAKRTFRQTLTDIVTTFQQAPVNPLQHLLRTAIVGDVLLQDVAYDLQSAIGTIETRYELAQKELFEIIGQNLKLEKTLQDANISYETTKDKPIIINYKINDLITNYDLSASNQKNKVAQVTILQQEVKQLETSYENLAQDLEAEKTQHTYLTLKLALHALKDPFAKTEVDEYQDAVASLLETDRKQQEQRDGKKRTEIALQRLAIEIYSTDPLLTSNYDQNTIETIVSKTSDAKIKSTLGESKYIQTTPVAATDIPRTVSHLRTIAKENEQAVQTYLKEKSLIPTIVEQAKSQRDTKQYNVALELCHFVSAVEPANPHAHYFAATTYEILGNNARKEKDLAKAIHFYTQAQQEFQLAGNGSSSKAGHERVSTANEELYKVVN